ncbi:hypothetical protein BDW62DRAFT_174523 [Aspergillus aurantiobrunneus]
MPSASSSTLSLTLLVAGHLYNRCTTTPNTTSSPYANDRIRFLTTIPSTLSNNISNLTTIYQALVTLFSTASPSDREFIAKLCPYPSHLNPERVSWNPRTVGYLALLAVGALIRLSAYGGLGRNFTFQLAAPDRLITSGVYRYLQHPSYTGVVLVLAGHAGLVMDRLDTPIACLIPGPLLQVLREWQVVLGGLGALFLFAAIVVRIRDEERMLREKFGNEWEEWHAKTARLIPGVF